MTWDFPHFAVVEFACHDGTPVPPDLVDTNLAPLVSQLEIVRPPDGLEIVSGYRTPSYNAAIDGAMGSRHKTADAADVRPIVRRLGHRIKWEFLSTAERLERIKAFHELVLRKLADMQLPLIGGLGFYAGKWLHLDTRPKPASGHLAQWIGQGVGSEVA